MKQLLLIILIFLYGCNQKAPKDKEEIKVNSLKTLTDNFSKNNSNWKTANGNWSIKDKAIIQSYTKNNYNAILNTKEKFTNFKAKVNFMPISGKWDASGGVIFRAQDKNNYYIIRANALEDNFSLYTFKNGSRSNLVEVSTKAPTLNKWHTITVIAKGKKIQGYLDGKLLINYKDNTFKNGYIGLWTKADSITKFDNFEVNGE